MTETRIILSNCPNDETGTATRRLASSIASSLVTTDPDDWVVMREHLAAVLWAFHTIDKRTAYDRLTQAKNP